MEDKISVIIPAYRSDKFIADIVNDILAQTYKNWELIVVSNGKGQEIQLTILEKIKKNFRKEENFFIISEERGSVSLARNIGIDHANGQWLTFVDADDRLDSNHLELLINATCSGNPDIVIGGYKTKSFVDKTYGYKNFPEINERGVKYTLSLDNGELLFPSWNKLFRTSFVRNYGKLYNQDFSYYEDGIAMVELLLCTNAINIIPMTGYIYITRPEQRNSYWHYHESLEEAILVLDNLLRKLMRQSGFIEEEINQRRNLWRFLDKYLLVQNIFRQGSPYTFRQRRAEVKRLFFNDAEMRELVKLERMRNHNTMKQCFVTCCLIGSPTAVVLLFYAKNIILSIIRRLQKILISFY